MAEEEIKTMQDDLELQNIGISNEPITNKKEISEVSKLEETKESETKSDHVHSLADYGDKHSASFDSGDKKRKKEKLPEDVLPLEKKNFFFKKTTKEIWSKKWRYLYLLIVPYLKSIMWPLIVLLVILAVYVVLSFVGVKSFVASSDVSIGIQIVNVALGITSLIVVIWFMVGGIKGICHSLASIIYYLHTSEPDRKKILKETKKNIWPLFKTQFLQSLIIFGGTILLIIPGIIWAIKYSYASYICVTEGKGARASLKKSGQLIYGYKWTNFYLGLWLELFWVAIGLVFSLVFLLLVLIASLHTIVAVVVGIVVMVLFLFNLFINFLRSPYDLAFKFYIFESNKNKKDQNPNARGKINFWKVLLVFLLVFVLGFVINFLVALADIKDKLDTAEGTTFLEQFQQASQNKSEENEYQNFQDDEQDFYFDDFMEEPEDSQSTTTDEMATSTEDILELDKDDNIATTTPEEVVNTDSDSDGLPDAIETEFATDPYLSDTDFDGLSDYDEITIYETDPLNADTDGDTYLDGLEVENGYDPLGPGRLKDVYNN